MRAFSIFIVSLLYIFSLSAQTTQTLIIGNLRYVGKIANGTPCGSGKFYVYEGKYAGKILSAGEYDAQGNLKIGIVYNLDTGLAAEQGEFSSGKLNGYGLRYSSRGIKHEAGIFKNGELVTGFIYNEEGKTVCYGDYSFGKLNGSGKIFCYNGNVLYQGELKNNEPNGYGAYYNCGSGKLKEQGYYNEGKLNGVGESYYTSTGTLERQGQFKGGRLNGIGRTFYRNGQLQYIGYFKEGNPSGLCLLYSDSGQLIEEGYYINGCLNGVGKIYYPNGKPKQEGNFCNGQLNGMGRTYLRDGTLYQVGNFIKGVFTGQGIMIGKKARLEGTFLYGRNVGQGAVFNNSNQCIYKGSNAQNFFEEYNAGIVTHSPVQTQHAQVSSSMGTLLASAALFAGAAYIADKLFPDAARSSSTASSGSSPTFFAQIADHFKRLNPKNWTKGGDYGNSYSSNRSNTEITTTQNSERVELTPHYDSPNEIPVPEMKNRDGWGKKNFEYEYSTVTFVDGREARVYRTTGEGDKHSGYGVLYSSLLIFNFNWYDTFENAMKASYIMKYYNATRTIGKIP